MTGNFYTRDGFEVPLNQLPFRLYMFFINLATIQVLYTWIISKSV